MFEQVLLFEAISETPFSIDHERSVIDFDMYIILVIKYLHVVRKSQPEVGTYSILIQIQWGFGWSYCRTYGNLPGYPSKK